MKTKETGRVLLLMSNKNFKTPANNGIRMKKVLLEGIVTPSVFGCRVQNGDITYSIKVAPNSHTSRWGPVDLYEPLDYLWRLPWETYRRQMQASPCRTLVCNSAHMASALRGANARYTKTVVAYHEYDIRYLENRSSMTDRVMYMGDPSKLDIPDPKSVGVEVVGVPFGTKDKESSVRDAPIRGVHVDYVRPGSTIYNIHTATKLSTAIALDCVFVCNRVPVYVELLGDEYPLYFEDDMSDFSAVVAQAVAIAKDPDRLRAFLYSVSEAKAKVSGASAVDRYITMFNSTEQ